MRLNVDRSHSIAAAADLVRRNLYEWWRLWQIWWWLFMSLL